MGIKSIPGRVLFDTNLVNLTLDSGAFNLEGDGTLDSVPASAHQDVEALRCIFLTGQRACWQLAISPVTYDEILATRCDYRRAELLGWFNELWLYWRDFFIADKLSDARADSLAIQLGGSSSLKVLPQQSDRILVAHAIAYHCDAFCTRDRRTILRHRDKLRDLPIRFLSPAEW